jgi:hypothetical protein
METNGMEMLLMKWSSVEQWMKWNGMDELNEQWKRNRTCNGIGSNGKDFMNQQRQWNWYYFGFGKM